MTTRDKILHEALSLFSVQGYEAVTIREIAAAVGIRESSLYNHFKNKQDILDTIVRKTLLRYDETLQRLQVPESTDPQVARSYDGIPDADFLEICIKIFLFYLKDEYISKLRKLLTIEQYGNQQLGVIYKDFFIERVLKTQTQVIQKFIDDGYFINGDAHTMALHFYAPIFLLLYKYDHSLEKEEQAIEELRKHVCQYNALYRKKNS